jgi:hypothetical protein
MSVATGVGAFLSLLGSFDSLGGWAARASMYLIFSWVGSLLGIVSARLVFRMGLHPTSFWLTGLLTGLVMAPPMLVVVFAANWIWEGRPIPREAWGSAIWNTVLICIGSSYMAVLIGRGVRPVTTQASATPPKFLERLPLKLRGGEVWAVEAEDHYLRLHTSKGQDLILMRLSDAIAELEGIEGMQVHRSWWVARDAITDAKRGDGRATLTLEDGSEVPVSRTYASQLREKGWI